jgi:hypothetical protein
VSQPNVFLYQRCRGVLKLLRAAEQPPWIQRVQHVRRQSNQEVVAVHASRPVCVSLRRQLRQRLLQARCADGGDTEGLHALPGQGSEVPNEYHPRYDPTAPRALAPR